jgi:hypothetical protein
MFTEAGKREKAKSAHDAFEEDVGGEEIGSSLDRAEYEFWWACRRSHVLPGEGMFDQASYLKGPWRTAGSWGTSKVGILRLGEVVAAELRLS